MLRAVRASAIVDLAFHRDPGAGSGQVQDFVFQVAIGTIDDIDGAKIAVLSGTTTEDVMRRAIEVNDFDVKLRLIKSHDEGMELLNDRKVDGYASDRAMMIGQVFRNENAKNEYALTARLVIAGIQQGGDLFHDKQPK